MNNNNGVGARVFDIALEGQTVQANYDIIAQSGAPATAIVESFVVTVEDGNLDIDLTASADNAKISAILVEETDDTSTPIVVQNIDDQQNAEGDDIGNSGLEVTATGGDGNLQYGAEGLPPGVALEPTNGQFIGSIQTGAATGGPNGDGIYPVTINVDDSDDDTEDVQTVNFQWTITAPSGPIISLLTPADNQVIYGDEVTVEWSVTDNPELDDHVHVYLDANGNPGDGIDDNYNGLLPLTGDFTYENVPPGEYIVKVEVANNNHDVYTNPGADEQVTIYVQPPRDPARVLYRVNNGGPQLAAADGSQPDWSIDTKSSPSPYRTSADNSTYNNQGDPVDTSDASLAGSAAPEALFQTERYGSQQAPIDWEFPVQPGTTVDVRLYFAEIYLEDSGPNANANKGPRVFDVSVEGTVPGLFDDIDQYDTAGHDTGFMLSTVVEVTDGTLNIDFVPDVENANIKGIEIIEQDAPITIDPVTDQSHVEGETISPVTVSASGGNGDLQFAASGLPGGLTIDADTGAVSGTVAAGAAAGGPNSDGIYPVTVTVSDTDLINGDDDATTTFNWTITEPTGPVLTINSPADGETVYSESVEVTWSAGNTVAGDTVNIYLDADLGDGITDNQITGQPTTGSYTYTGVAAGTYAVQVEVVDENGDVYPQSPATDQVLVMVEPPLVPAGALYRVNNGGPQLAATDGSSPAWSADTGGSGKSDYLTSPTNKVYSVTNAIDTNDPSLNGTAAPMALFQTERYDDSGSNMTWAFPVDAGTSVEVRLYFAEIFLDDAGGNSNENAGPRVFDVSVEDNVPGAFNQIDQYASAGHDVGFMRAATVTVQDGTLNIALIPDQENPNIKGIEIVELVSTDNNRPMVTNPGDQTNEVNDVVTLPINATDDDTEDTLTYTATNLPDGLSIDENTGVISGTVAECTTTGEDQPFVEQNGDVYIEVESVTPDDPNWSLETTFADYTGSGYYVWTGPNKFGDSSAGTTGVIEYPVYISTLGTYEFKWRNAYSGESASDQNDSWLRIIGENLDDTEFYGADGSGNNIVYPKGSSAITPETTPEGNGGNGWFKAYRSGGDPGTWNWLTRTSDGENLDIFIDVDEPGIYVIQVAARSQGHAIDRLSLRESGNPQASAPESPRSSQCVYPQVYDVTVSVTDDGEPPLAEQVQFTWTIGADVTDNTPPSIDDISPNPVQVVAGETAAFDVTASDPDNAQTPSLSVAVVDDSDSSTVDPANYTFTDNGDGTADFEWVTAIGDEGNYTATVTADDGTVQVNQTVNIEITANQAPQIVAVDPITVEETETATTSITATDAESDPLTLSLALVDDSDSRHS